MQEAADCSVKCRELSGAFTPRRRHIAQECSLYSDITSENVLKCRFALAALDENQTFMLLRRKMSEHVNDREATKGSSRKVWTSAYLWGWARGLGLFQQRRRKGRFSASMKTQNRTLSSPWLRPASESRPAGSALAMSKKCREEIPPEVFCRIKLLRLLLCSRGRWRKWRNRRWCLIASASTWAPGEVMTNPWREWERERRREREGRVSPPDTDVLSESVTTQSPI